PQSWSGAKPAVFDTRSERAQSIEHDGSGQSALPGRKLAERQSTERKPEHVATLLVRFRLQQEVAEQRTTGERSRESRESGTLFWRRQRVRSHGASARGITVILD